MLPFFQKKCSYPKSMGFVSQCIFTFCIPSFLAFITNINLQQPGFIFSWWVHLIDAMNTSLDQKTVFFEPRPDTVFPLSNTPLYNCLLVFRLHFFCVWLQSFQDCTRKWISRIHMLICTCMPCWAQLFSLHTCLPSLAGQSCCLNSIGQKEVCKRKLRHWTGRSLHFSPSC